MEKKKIRVNLADGEGAEEALPHFFYWYFTGTIDEVIEKLKQLKLQLANYTAFTDIGFESVADWDGVCVNICGDREENTQEYERRIERERIAEIQKRAEERAQKKREEARILRERAQLKKLLKKYPDEKADH